MSTRKTFILTVLGIALVWGGGFAQDLDDLMDLSLDDLLNMEVTTASKKAEKTSDAPGVVTVITGKEIAGFGAQNLMDVLERVPSLQAISSHLFCQNVAAMRGDLFTHSDMHVLVLLNGRPVREGANGGINNPVYTSFPVEMIKQIEVVRGPGSVLYGSNAFAGVINIITKEAEEGFYASANVGAGSYGATKGAANFGYAKGDLNALISVDGFSDDGWDFEAWGSRPGETDSLFSMVYAEEKLGLAANVNYKSLQMSAFYSSGKDDVLG